MLPPRDQGTQSTCLDHQIAAVLQERNVIDPIAQLDPTLSLSPQWLYNHREPNPFTGQQGRGHHWRNALRLARDVGLVLEQSYPYEDKIELLDSGNPKKEYKDLYKEAKNLRAGDWGIVHNIKHVIQGFNDHAAPIMLVSAYNYGEKNNGKIWKKMKGDKYLAEHALTIVGYKWNDKNYDDGYFVLQNTWGTDWNDGGYTTMTFGEFNEKVKNIRKVSKTMMIYRIKSY